MKECDESERLFRVCAVSTAVTRRVRSAVLRAGARRLVIGVYGGVRFSRTVLQVSELVMRSRLRVIGPAWQDF